MPDVINMNSLLVHDVDAPTVVYLATSRLSSYNGSAKKVILSRHWVGFVGHMGSTTEGRLDQFLKW